MKNVIVFLIIAFSLALTNLVTLANDIEIPPPIDIFLLIDQSGSMKHTDPKAVRIKAAGYFVKYLANNWSEVFNHRLGVVNFGDRPPANPKDEVVPLLPLTQKNINTILTHLKPMNLGNTKFIDALEKAHTQFLKAKENIPRQKSILIFTDGEPDDSRKLSIKAYFNEIQRFVNKSLDDCLIYVVAVDINNKYWPRDKKYWDNITKGHAYKIEKMSEQILDKMYTQILGELLHTSKIKWDKVPPEGLNVEIEPYLESVTFSILKENPKVEVAIIRNNGKKVIPTDPDVKYSTGKMRISEIYTIYDPSPGIWHYKIEKGRGKVEIGKAIIPVEIRLLSPKSPHPQGKHIQIVASFLKRDGTPVVEHPAYRLWLGGDITTPDLKVNRIEFKQTEKKGIYKGEGLIPTPEEGEYTLSLVMKGGDRIISQKKIPVLVKPVPYLFIMSPAKNTSYPLYKGMDVKVKLMRKGKQADPEKLFTDNPNSLVWVQVINPRGKVIKSLSLTYNKEKGGLFEAKAENLQKKGEYTLRFHLAGHLKDGTSYKALPEKVSFIKKMVFPYDPIKYLLYHWYILVIIGIALFIGYFIYYNSLPKPTGWVYIKKGKEELFSSSLSGRRYKVNIEGKKIGYIAARWEKTEEGQRQSVPYIRYQPEPGSKTYNEETLYDGSIIQVGEYTIEYCEYEKA